MTKKKLITKNQRYFNQRGKYLLQDKYIKLSLRKLGKVPLTNTNKKETKASLKKIKRIKITTKESNT